MSKTKPTTTEPEVLGPHPSTLPLTLSPTEDELVKRPGLAPLPDIAERLAEAIRATAQYQRKSTVVVTYGIQWDEEVMTLRVGVAVKSKRPVMVKRNEEVIGDEEVLFEIGKDPPGQQRASYGD